MCAWGHLFMQDDQTCFHPDIYLESPGLFLVELWNKNDLANGYIEPIQSQPVRGQSLYWLLANGRSTFERGNLILLGAVRVSGRAKKILLYTIDFTYPLLAQMVKSCLSTVPLNRNQFPEMQQSNNLYIRHSHFSEFNHTLQYEGLPTINELFTSKVLSNQCYLTFVKPSLT